MFYVYSGYVSPDNYDCSEGPTYTLVALKTADEVAAAKAEFEANLHSECSNAIFRVIEGNERSITPVSVIQKWALG